MSVINVHTHNKSSFLCLIKSILGTYIVDNGVFGYSGLPTLGYWIIKIG